jgi:DNA-binding response OmpR family regulator
LAAGADAFLVKGCPAEELLAAILNHVGVSPSRAPRSVLTGTETGTRRGS